MIICCWETNQSPSNSPPHIYTHTGSSLKYLCIVTGSEMQFRDKIKYCQNFQWGRKGRKHKVPIYQRNEALVINLTVGQCSVTIVRETKYLNNEVLAEQPNHIQHDPIN